MDPGNIPELLLRHCRACLGDGGSPATDTRLEQVGEMRLAENKAWMPFTAEQWMSASEVAFCWHARFKMAPLLTGVVEDAYENGHGRLDAKMWGVIPVAHARGLEIDRGEIQRYLAELPWNPTAILHNPHLHFAEGADGPVRVWCGDPETHVDFQFDPQGRITRSFSRTRVRAGHGVAPWEGTFHDYAEFDGMWAPTRAEVAWHSAAGRFEYWRGRVTWFGPR